MMADQAVTQDDQIIIVKPDLEGDGSIYKVVRRNDRKSGDTADKKEKRSGKKGVWIGLAAVLVFFLLVGTFIVLDTRSPFVWDLTPNMGTVIYFRGKVFDVEQENPSQGLPSEMGWLGNEITLRFPLDENDLRADSFQFEFNVTFKDFNTDEHVALDIYAGRNLNRLKLVKEDLVIDRLGEYSVPIEKAYFREGEKNFIRLSGKNVAPIGYGKNPPNCKFGFMRLRKIKN